MLTSHDPRNNNSLVSPRSLLSSVATYQTDDTAIMVDLVGTTAPILDDWHRQEDLNNLFSQFWFFNWSTPDQTSNADLVAPLGTSSRGGFTCIYNIADSMNGIGTWTFGSHSPTTGTPGTTGNYVLICVSFNAVAEAAYEPYMLGQNDNNINGTFGTWELPTTRVSNISPNKIYPASSSNSLFVLATNPAGSPDIAPPLNNTDLIIIPLSGLGSDFGVVHLDTQRKVSLTHLDFEGRVQGMPVSTWSQSTQYDHISACGEANSSIIYTYYQVNETALGEVQFNPGTGFWTVSSPYIHFDTDTAWSGSVTSRRRRDVSSVFGWAEHFLTMYRWDAYHITFILKVKDGVFSLRCPSRSYSRVLLPIILAIFSTFVFISHVISKH